MKIHPLKFIYPSLIEGKDYVLNPDGSIKEWLTLHPPPSPGVLQEMTDQIEEEAYRQEIKKEARRRILSLFDGDPGKETRALRKGLVLIRKRAAGQALTEEESSLESYLVAINDKIELIIEHGNALEQDPSLTPNWPT